MVILITGTSGIAEATTGLARSRGHQPFSAGLPEFDFTQPGAAERALERCVQSHGRVDALFNVAGASGRRHGDGPLHECSDAGWRFTLDANLTTMFHMTRAVLKQMIAQNAGGSILNMSSVLASRPEPTQFATHVYAAAKGAIESLTRSMAAYYAAHGIRVNAIAPGLTRTPMSKRAQDDPSILKLLKSKQPLARDLIDAGEIAKAALFLLSDESREITGQVLTVDAGWSIA